MKRLVSILLATLTIAVISCNKSIRINRRLVCTFESIFDAAPDMVDVE